MPGIIDRIAQTRTLIATTASLVLLLLQYVALSTFVTLPHDPSEMARIISFALTITTTLVILGFSAHLKAANDWWVGLVALALAVLGAVLILNYSSYAGRYVKTEPATCSEGRPETVIVPERPSSEINGILEAHGDYETALCDVRDQGWLRRTIDRDNDTQTINLVVRLVLAQLFLVIGILLAAWKLILRSPSPAAGGAAAGATGPAPPSGNEGSG